MVALEQTLTAFTQHVNCKTAACHIKHDDKDSFNSIPFHNVCEALTIQQVLALVTCQLRRLMHHHQCAECGTLTNNTSSTLHIHPVAELEMYKKGRNLNYKDPIACTQRGLPTPQLIAPAGLHYSNHGLHATCP